MGTQGRLRHRGRIPPTALTADDAPGNTFLIVDLEEAEGDWHVHTRLLDEGGFPLEYRDGVAAEHFQANSVTRQQVATAVSGWLNRDPGWKDGFTWANIASRFPQDRSATEAGRGAGPLLR